MIAQFLLDRQASLFHVPGVKWRITPARFLRRIFSACRSSVFQIELNSFYNVAVLIGDVVALTDVSAQVVQFQGQMWFVAHDFPFSPPHCHGPGRTTTLVLRLR